MTKDPYTVLGVSRNASQDEIKKAYRDLAKKYHPDNYQDSPLKDLAQEKMSEINEAYAVLTRDGGNTYHYGGGTYSQGSAYGNPGEQGPFRGFGSGWPFGARGGAYQQNPNQNPNQNPGGNFYSYRSRNPYVGGMGRGGSCFDDLCCLCCADSCCESMGGDLCSCC